MIESVFPICLICLVVVLAAAAGALTERGIWRRRLSQQQAMFFHAMALHHETDRDCAACRHLAQQSQLFAQTEKSR